MTVTLQEYSWLAVDAYNGNGASTPHADLTDWDVVNVTYTAIDSDFSATTYINGSEIVISYRGTDELSELLTDSAQIELRGRITGTVY